MIHKITKNIPAVPARTENIENGIECDLCHTWYHNARTSFDGGIKWASGYEVNETILTRKTGEDYPDGGHHTYYSYHVCPDCWESRILTLFDTKPTEEAVDY